MNNRRKAFVLAPALSLSLVFGSGVTDTPVSKPVTVAEAATVGQCKVNGWMHTASWRPGSTQVMLSGVTNQSRFGRNINTTATVRGWTRDLHGNLVRFVRVVFKVGAARPYNMPKMEKEASVRFVSDLNHGGDHTCTATAARY